MRMVRLLHVYWCIRATRWNRTWNSKLFGYRTVSISSVRCLPGAIAVVWVTPCGRSGFFVVSTRKTLPTSVSFAWNLRVMYERVKNADTCCSTEIWPLRVMTMIRGCSLYICPLPSTLEIESREQFSSILLSQSTWNTSTYNYEPAYSEIKIVYSKIAVPSTNLMIHGLGKKATLIVIR